MELTPRAAVRRLTRERVDLRRAYRKTTRLLEVLGMGEGGTLETLHGISMYAAAVIRAGAAEDPRVARSILAWMCKDLKKGVFMTDGRIRRKRA